MRTCGYSDSNVIAIAAQVAHFHFVISVWLIIQKTEITTARSEPESIVLLEKILKRGL